MPRKKKQESERRSEFGSTRLLKSGRWQARWTNPDGSRGTSTHDSERVAKDALTVARSRHLTGTWQPVVPETITLLAVWDRYVFATPTDSGAVARKRAQFREGFLTGTARAAQKTVNGRRVRSPLGRYVITQVTRPVLNAWVEEMIAEDLATSTIEGHWMSMRGVLTYAVNNGLLAKHPAAVAPTIPAAKRRRDAHSPFVMTLPEMVAITNAAIPRHRLFIETLLWSGMRSSEARALDGPDIEQASGLVRVDFATTQGEDRSNILLKVTKSIASAWVGSIA